MAPELLERWRGWPACQPVHRDTEIPGTQDGNGVRPYTRLVSSLVFPLHERLKGHDTVRVRRALERSQWLSPEALAELQSQRLQRLVRRAFEAVPFYAERFRACGLEPEDIRRPADLVHVPLLTKAEIRAGGDALRARDAGRLTRMNTGGSTGEPLIFWLGSERVTHDVAAKWRATRWWGVDIGDREAVVWGSPVELGAQDRIRALRDRLLRTRLLPAFEMSPERVREFLRALRRQRPQMVFGYPSAIAHLARAAEAEGTRLDDLGVRVVFCTAERLYDADRALISRAFGAPVANGYGGRDAGFIAHECPQGGLHITAEDIIVEVVGNDGTPLPPGRQGEVVVTHLASGDFPFIRYRTGDVATLSDGACPCGRGLPLIAELHGRTTDFVVAADGTVMHGLALIYVVRDLPGIARFRIEQESLDHTRVLVVPEEGFGQAQLEAIERGLRERLGRGVRVSVEPVASIPPLPSGKHRYVVSRVPAVSTQAA